MRRWCLLFAVLLGLGHILWPWLADIGLARLPGDIALVLGGQEVQLPIATALLISLVITGVWHLLDRDA